MTLDVPNVFIQTHLEDECEQIILILQGPVADSSIDTAPEICIDFVCVVKGQNVPHLECTNVIQGMLKAALPFCKKFKKDIKSKGFEMNPHDQCMANQTMNGKQMTVLWHVADLKASHVARKTLDEFVEFLQSKCDNKEIGEIKVNKGPQHEHVGMVLDHSQDGKSTIDMGEHTKKMLDDFKCQMTKSAKTPAADHLFKIDESCKN